MVDASLGRASPFPATSSQARSDTPPLTKSLIRAGQTLPQQQPAPTTSAPPARVPSLSTLLRAQQPTYVAGGPVSDKPVSLDGPPTVFDSTPRTAPTANNPSSGARGPIWTTLPLRRATSPTAAAGDAPRPTTSDSGSGYNPPNATTTSNGTTVLLPGSTSSSPLDAPGGQAGFYPITQPKLGGGGFYADSNPPPPMQPGGGQAPQPSSSAGGGGMYSSPASGRAVVDPLVIPHSDFPSSSLHDKRSPRDLPPMGTFRRGPMPLADGARGPSPPNVVDPLQGRLGAPTLPAAATGGGGLPLPRPRQYTDVDLPPAFRGPVRPRILLRHEQQAPSPPPTLGQPPAPTAAPIPTGSNGLHPQQQQPSHGAPMDGSEPPGLRF